MNHEACQATHADRHSKIKVYLAMLWASKLKFLISCKKEQQAKLEDHSLISRMIAPYLPIDPSLISSTKFLQLEATRKRYKDRSAAKESDSLQARASRVAGSITLSKTIAEAPRWAPLWSIPVESHILTKCTGLCAVNCCMEFILRLHPTDVTYVI